MSSHELSQLAQKRTPHQEYEYRRKRADIIYGIGIIIAGCIPVMGWIWRWAL